MRLARFLYKNKERWGAVCGQKIRLLKTSPFGVFALSKTYIPAEGIRLLAPAAPSKIILTGLNYKDHARELQMAIPKEPVLFLKAPTALIAHEENIVIPRGAQRIDYEAELALVIKKKGKNIPLSSVSKHILGYTCLNDVTARDIQKRDGQWMRAKSFDTFCPFGPWLETEIDPAHLNIKTYLNGVLKQDSNTRNLIFSIPFLVAYISRCMTLLPGDIISTGTPAGIGKLRTYDIIEVEIEGIGRLKNRVTGSLN